MRKSTNLAALTLLGLALSAAAAVPARAADTGEQVFKRNCSICHDTEPGKNKVGPSLAGIFGRKSGEESGYTYSEAMQSAGLTWDEPTLDKYLADPRSTVPGNKMLFPGVKNPDDRHALITYLKSLKS